MQIQWPIPSGQEVRESGKGPVAPLVLRAGDRLTASVLEVEKQNDALLAFGQFKAYARLPLPVVAGQQLQIQVEASQPDRLGLVMLPTKGPSPGGPTGERLEIRLFEPLSENASFTTQARSLLPGTALSGRITGFEKAGLKLVDFGAFKAFAKIDIPVRPGQVIPLTVVEGDQGVSLAVRSRSDAAPVVDPVSPAPDAARLAQAGPRMPPASGYAAAPTDLAPPTGGDMAILREQIQALLERTTPAEKVGSVSLPGPVKAALANLIPELDPASTAGDVSVLAARIKALVEHSGSYFEKRVETMIRTLQTAASPMTTSDLAAHPAIRDLMASDLKPNLWILKQFMDLGSLESKGTDRQAAEMLKGLVQRAVDQIDRQQFTATERPVDPDAFQAFSHLLLLDDTGRNARLKAYYAKKGRDDEQKHPRVSLLLEMKRLGTVRTDLWMVNRDLNITFFVVDADVKAAVESGYQRIVKILDGAFNTVAVSVVVNQKKIADFDGEDLVLSDPRQVDVKA